MTKYGTKKRQLTIILPEFQRPYSTLDGPPPRDSSESFALLRVLRGDPSPSPSPPAFSQSLSPVDQLTCSDQ